MIHKATVQSIYQGKLENVKLLYTKTDLNVNKQTVDGNTSLFFACLWGQVDVAAFLLQQGADYSLKNSKGETPLSVARKQGYRGIILLLQQYGATQ
jgi:ankyrin repeat protein